MQSKERKIKILKKIEECAVPGKGKYLSLSYQVGYANV